MAQVLETVSNLNNKIDILSTKQEERDKRYALREEHLEEEIQHVKEDNEKSKMETDVRFDTIEETVKEHDNSISKIKGIGIAFGVVLTVINIVTSLLSWSHYFPSFFH